MVRRMTIENAIRLMAGSLVLLGTALGAAASPLFVSAWFLWLPAFVGANLAQSSLTGFCPAAMIFRALGLKDAAACGVAPAQRPSA